MAVCMLQIDNNGLPSAQPGLGAVHNRGGADYAGRDYPPVA